MPSIVFLYGICWFFSVNSIFCSWIYINIIPCTMAVYKTAQTHTHTSYEYWIGEQYWRTSNSIWWNAPSLAAACIVRVRCEWFAKSIWECFVFICLSLDVYYVYCSVCHVTLQSSFNKLSIHVILIESATEQSLVALRVAHTSPCENRLQLNRCVFALSLNTYYANRTRTDTFLSSIRPMRGKFFLFFCSRSFRWTQEQFKCQSEYESALSRMNECLIELQNASHSFE